MNYTFEKVADEESYQVRLNGEFVTYVKHNDPKLVDEILKENGWNTKEAYYKYLTSGRKEGSNE